MLGNYVISPDIRKIRRKLNLTVTEFSFLFGFKKTSINSWERGFRPPPYICILLHLLDKDSNYVINSLRYPTETEQVIQECLLDLSPLREEKEMYQIYNNVADNNFLRMVLLLQKIAKQTC